MLRSTFGAILRTRITTNPAVYVSRVGQPLAMTLRWHSEKAFLANITFEELQERIQAGKQDSVSSLTRHITLLRSLFSHFFFPFRFHQYTLIDVREPGELIEGIIPTATSVPLVR
jgi:hypothetical protein